MEMLEYQKLILEKVSFNKELFKKELSKSHNWLNSYEFNLLLYWALKTFNYKYAEIIFNIFNKYSYKFKLRLNKIKIK